MRLSAGVVVWLSACVCFLFVSAFDVRGCWRADAASAVVVDGRVVVDFVVVIASCCVHAAMVVVVVVNVVVVVVVAVVPPGFVFATAGCSDCWLMGFRPWLVVAGSLG